MRYFVIILCSLFSLSAVAQSDSLAVAEPVQTVVLDSKLLWDSGNKDYIDGNYSSALERYTAIEQQGKYSARLYYNIGNCYFKLGNVGKSILYYNRALKAQPTMEDARENLRIAEAQTKDKIAVVPEFFLNRWMRSVRTMISCTVWSVLSISLFGLVALFVLLFLLGSRLVVRKSGFYGTIVALLLFIVATLFAASSRRDMLDSRGAVVISSAISVKSSPDKAATDMFVLHEGTKVTLLSEVDGWVELTIADGKKGWTEASHARSWPQNGAKIGYAHS